ncbi:MAG TPA: hypothetical protein VKY26_11495 [Actinomycetota bacterium]|nr:hypothetical protein [Actinomycetota bacterium]
MVENIPLPIMVGVIVGLAFLVVCGLAGAHCSKVRGRPEQEGFAFGLLLGPLGILIAAVLASPPAAPQPQAARPSPRAKSRPLLGEVSEPWMGEIDES